MEFTLPCPFHLYMGVSSLACLLCWSIAGSCVSLRICLQMGVSMDLPRVKHCRVLYFTAYLSADEGERGPATCEALQGLVFHCVSVCRWGVSMDLPHVKHCRVLYFTAYLSVDGGERGPATREALQGLVFHCVSVDGGERGPAAREAAAGGSAP